MKRDTNYFELNTGGSCMLYFRKYAGNKIKVWDNFTGRRTKIRIIEKTPKGEMYFIYYNAEYFLNEFTEVTPSL